MRDVTVTPSSLFIAEANRLAVSFVPIHDMPASAIIRIQVTRDVLTKCPDFDTPEDFVYNSQNLNAPTRVVCGRFGFPPKYTTVTMTNPLKKEYTHGDRAAVKAGSYEPGKVIQVVLPGTTNPLSARDVKGIKISTMTEDMQVIDTYTDESTLLFTVKAKPIYAAKVTPAVKETFSSSGFEFSLTLANQLLMGSYMEVYLPSEVKLIDNSVPTLSPTTNMDVTTSQIQLTTDSFGT